MHTFVVVWFFKGQHNMTAAFCVITLSWLFVVLFVIISATTTHNYFTPDTVSLATMFSAAGTMLT